MASIFCWTTPVTLRLTRATFSKGYHSRAIVQLCNGRGGIRSPSGKQPWPRGCVPHRWLSTSVPGGDGDGGGDEGTSGDSGPLAGVRVLDLTRALAGPFCTMLLGDLGAEVIKVEKPGEGDESRTWGPFVNSDTVNSETVYFLSVNRNKKSITVNLKSEKGKEIIKQLVSKSDIFVENYIPGKLDRLGLGYADLAAVNPSLLYCSITGFGGRGPYAQRGGYDVIAASYAGLVGITGSKDGDPARVGVSMTDLSTGLFAHGAIMAALLQRNKTGRGQRVECNLLASQVALMSHLATAYLVSGVISERQGTAHHSIVPYQGFKTSDGWLVLGAANNKQFKNLCEVMGIEELIDDERYATNEDRSNNRGPLIAELSARFSQFPTSHWLKVMEGCKFPYGPINNMQQVFADPQVQYLNLAQTLHHSTVGEVSVPGPAVTYSGFTQTVRLSPPTLGEHTEEVLCELLKYSQHDIRELSEHGHTIK